MEASSTWAAGVKRRLGTELSHKRAHYVNRPGETDLAPILATRTEVNLQARNKQFLRLKLTSRKPPRRRLINLYCEQAHRLDESHVSEVVFDPVRLMRSRVKIRLGMKTPTSVRARGTENEVKTVSAH